MVFHWIGVFGPSHWLRVFGLYIRVLFLATHDSFGKHLRPKIFLPSVNHPINWLDTFFPSRVFFSRSQLGLSGKFRVCTLAAV